MPEAYVNYALSHYGAGAAAPAQFRAITQAA